MPLLLAVLASGPALAAETVTFRFAPPVGQPFEMKGIGTGTFKWGGNKETMSVGARARQVWSRAGDGYRLVEQTEEVAFAIDGKPAESPLAAKLAANRLVHVVGGDGALVRVEGARENLERLLPLLTGESRKSAEKRIAEGRFGESEAATWYETVEILAGQSLELGRDYWFPAAAKGDEGWIAHQILFRLGPWEETPVGRRLRIRGAFVRSALVEIPTAVRLAPRVRSRFDPERPGRQATGYAVTGNFSRLIDPSTMSLHRDQLYRRETHEIRPNDSIGITFAVEQRLDVTYLPAAP